MKNSSLSKLLLSILLFFTGTAYAQDNNPNEAMPVTDADGNVYKTNITQEGMWMAENLKTTKFNDGTGIPLIRDLKTWSDVKTPAYGWYRDESGYRNTYGAIYNWYAVATGKLCPAGWHVPTEEEWNEIMDYAGGNEKSGDNPAKLKEAGTAHWKSPNEGATNDIFFTALPAGEVSYFYTDAEPGTMTNWWTSTEDISNKEPGSNEPPSNAEIVGLKYNFHSKTLGTYQKESMLPVRCKKDD
jgi:uncharacterized protein (TIGR02145 family)